MTTIPNPPSTGDEFTNELTGVTYRYDGEKWLAVSSPVDESVEELTERVANGETKQSEIEGVIADALVVQANKVDKTGDTMTGTLNAPRVNVNGTGTGRVFEAKSDGDTAFWVNATGQARTNFVVEDDAEEKTLTTKKYVDDKLGDVDTELGSYLPLTGGTLTGQLNMDNKKIQVKDASGDVRWYAQGSGFCKSYDMFRVERDIDGPAFQARIDTTVNAEIRTNGTASFKGNVNLNSNKITNLDTPTSNNDAANKSYVDTKFDGIVIPDVSDFATETYVDNAVDGLVSKTGDTMTGRLRIQSESSDASPAFRVEPQNTGSASSDIVHVKDKTGNIIFYVNGTGAVGANTSYTPSLNQHLTPKKYVDDAVTAAVNPKIYPGLRFKFGNSTTAVPLQKFNYYNDGGLRLRLSTHCLDYKWLDGGLTVDYSFSEGHRFSIYEQLEDGNLKVIRTGTYNRIDYHTNDCLMRVSSHQTNGSFNTNSIYHLTISGLF